MEKWLFTGEIEDPFGEFFVTVNPVEGNFWSQKYLLVDEKLPGFIPKDLAEMVLLIGKTVSLLRSIDSSFNPKAGKKGFESKS